MKLKKGVKLLGIRPELLIAIQIAEGIYTEHGQELVITSVCDGKHSFTSLHYSGNAVDFRTRYFDEQTILNVALALQTSLTKDFDVVIEPTHLHIEYQPRK